MEELAPLARRIAENTDLMERFRAVIGSQDKRRAEAMILEVTRYAQGLDATITGPEGTSITIVLMQIVGHPKARSND